MCHSNSKARKQILATLSLKTGPDRNKKIVPEKSRINKKVVEVKKGYVLCNGNIYCKMNYRRL